MENIKIVVDSSSDLTELSGVDFACAALQIVTEDKQYVDDASLNVGEMAEYLYRYKGKSSTSCPNVSDWLDAFGDAERILCFTITASLSGSYEAASIAKQIYEEEHPGCRIELINTLTAGPEIALMAEKSRDMILEGMSFEQITKKLKNYKTALLFVLESMKNLANNGRVSKFTAAAAGFLGVRAIGKASDQGTLEMLSKCTSVPKVLHTLVSYMKEFGFKGGKARICHCLNPSLAKALAEKIAGAFPSAKVVIEECRGLCSFYAEKGGLLMGFET